MPAACWCKRVAASPLRLACQALLSLLHPASAAAMPLAQTGCVLCITLSYTINQKSGKALPVQHTELPP